jgi:hypothetical protein
MLPSRVPLVLDPRFTLITTPVYSVVGHAPGAVATMAPPVASSHATAAPPPRDAAIRGTLVVLAPTDEALALLAGQLIAAFPRLALECHVRPLDVAALDLAAAGVRRVRGIAALGRGVPPSVAGASKAPRVLVFVRKTPAVLIDALRARFARDATGGGAALPAAEPGLLRAQLPDEATGSRAGVEGDADHKAASGHASKAVANTSAAEIANRRAVVARLVAAGRNAEAAAFAGRDAATCAAVVEAFVAARRPDCLRAFSARAPAACASEGAWTAALCAASRGVCDTTDLSVLLPGLADMTLAIRAAAAAGRQPAARAFALVSSRARRSLT